MAKRNKYLKKYLSKRQHRFSVGDFVVPSNYSIQKNKRRKIKGFPNLKRMKGVIKNLVIWESECTGYQQNYPRYSLYYHIDWYEGNNNAEQSRRFYSFVEFWGDHWQQIDLKLDKPNQMKAVIARGLVLLVIV